MGYSRVARSSFSWYSSGLVFDLSPLFFFFFFLGNLMDYHLGQKSKKKSKKEYIEFYFICFT